ncbi:amidase [Chromobacterium sp. LK11]|uniref:amidase n=1 Tax=Chromobacterium sp. LK11 TaxID=1628212 RepID=UPI0006547BAE|nr:amidase [Chromobacterium sp. LK11]KMN83744.1 amidase [Chromobacterium sp. LK11]
MKPTVMQMHRNLLLGNTSSVALTEGALDAIAGHQGAEGAIFTQVHAHAALAAARRIDASKRFSTPLAGIPLSVNDSFDIQGAVTTAGSVVLKPSAPAGLDAEAVSKLRQAGAVLLGRTNMSEFAYSGLGLNPHYGTPRNPGDPERVAGGSSSGAAVSVALGLSAAALVSDTGGSARIPAAFCGLVGFKATARRMPMQGCLPLSPSLDSIGTLARSVSCCAILDAALSGGWLPAHASGQPPDVKKRRLYVTEDYLADQTDPTVAQAFDAALACLSRAGARIIRFDFPELGWIADMDAQGGLAAAEAWRWHRERLEGESGDSYDPRIAQGLRQGAGQSAVRYLELLERRRALQAVAAHRLSMADAWLMPTVAILPPKLAELDDDDAYGRLNQLALRNSAVINLLDGCAASLPLTGQIGLGVCGLQGRDAHILKLAAGIERALANR